MFSFDYDAEGKFYYEYPACDRSVGNMREETDRRARELYEQNPKILLSVSSGIDSQSMLHSFHQQSIPFEAVFMFMPNYNNRELAQLRKLERKYGFQAHIVEIDPIAHRQQIELEAEQNECHTLAILHKLFLERTPQQFLDYDFVQLSTAPAIIHHRDRRYYFMCYNDIETSKRRVLAQVPRQGSYIDFAGSTAFILSMINDPTFRASVTSRDYFAANGLVRTDSQEPLTDEDTWDFYVKPLMFAQYWGNELEYFPKFVGYEHVPYMINQKLTTDTRGILIPYDQFIEDLSQGQGRVRYYQNVPHFFPLVQKQWL
jgi:hypothetical protein